MTTRQGSASKNDILKQYFGYDEFREGQAEIIDALSGGRDVLGVMPTGAGKSICYQIPAIMSSGVTLVISPLISLMRDQVGALVKNGVSAAFINSSLTEGQWQKAMSLARSGKYKIIYIAPERLLSPSTLSLARSVEISLVAVDEAHCISQWGQDFRPAYLDIPKFIAELPTRPVVAAFTATATVRVREDILSTLKLRSPLSVVTGFDRPNLYFEVRRPSDKYAELKKYLNGNDSGGIVYCSTRKDVETVAERLIADGYSAARYHAGLPDSERSRSQDDFINDRVKIIVATNAFGMGIDKSNVRFVVHYNMPQNVESYYQEAGRAGRDALPSDCILFYSRGDVNTVLFLINKSENADEVARNRILLNHMEQYCEGDGCLRNFMLQYFGERITDGCGNCGNCVGNYEETDVTVDAQKILSHIMRLNKAGRRFMFTHTADILQGKSEDFTDLSTFGIMKGVPRHYIRKLVTRLAALGYIIDDGYLSVAPSAAEVLRGAARVSFRGVVPGAKENGRKKIGAAFGGANNQARAVSEELFAKLKALRLEIAAEESVPAFVIFSDATLVDMCAKLPQNSVTLLDVSGVGRVKLERYGARFLEILQKEETSAQAAQKTQPFSAELFREFVNIDAELVTVSRVADNISAALLRFGRPKISGVALNKMLIEGGYLEVADEAKLPSEIGRASGIAAVERVSERGTAYVQCMFDEGAQRVCAEIVLLEMMK